MRDDWKALESEYVAAGDEVTLESLSSKHGVSLVALSRHAKVEHWEFLQARWRVYMRRPQKTDILERLREDFDARCEAILKRVSVALDREG